MNPYSKALRDLDRGLNSQLNRLSKAINASCEKVELRIMRMENSVKNYVAKNIVTTEAELKIADMLVKKELRGKMIMSQWTSGFLAENEEKHLDPITFAFARFSLNISLCYTEVSPAYFIKSNVHVLLISLTGFDSDLVAGPALLGLMHLSLLEPEEIFEDASHGHSHSQSLEASVSKGSVINIDGGQSGIMSKDDSKLSKIVNMKASIVDEHLLPALLPHMVYGNSKYILIQACKLCASLALYFPNKPELARSGCFHSLFDLLQGDHKDVNEDIQYAALCALVNIVNGSDANRNLAVELKGIRPLLVTIRMSSNDFLLYEACKVLVNMCFCNSYTSGCVLSSAGDMVLLQLLDGCDILRNNEIVHAALCALTNMSNSETNQSHVGAAEGCVDTALRIVEHAREPYVIQAAANLILALVLRNKGNKARLGAKGACQIFLKRIIRHAQYCNQENHILCIERICMAISSILLYEPNQALFHDIGGLNELVRIGKQYSNQRLLAAIAPVMITVMPSPDELKKFHDDEYVHPMEKVEMQPILKKIRLNGFGHLASSPAWLDTGIALLNMTDEDLVMQPHWFKEEYEEKMITFREFSTEIYPDTGLNNFNPDTKGLLFSAY